MISAVLDTNVLVSANIRPDGNSGRIVEAGQTGAFEMLISEYILKELADVLSRPHIQGKYKKQAAPRKRSIYIKEVRSAAHLVQVKSEVDEVEDDPKDNAVLACGVDGQANYVVSGDPHLLRLKTFRGIKIVTPVQFLEILKIMT